MLGNWIYSKEEDECGQVYELREDFVEIDVELPKEGQACWIDGEPEDFHGIPLSEETLELNGWRRSGDRWGHPDIQYWLIEWDVADKRFLIALETLGKSLLHISELRYVHEFQNFLRAAGFVDEADTFKVK